MRISILMILLTCSFTISSVAQTNLYDFKVTSIDGKPISLSQFKGQKVMIVNVASKCGLTPQYEQLQKVYELYGGDNFTIVAFPANNFKSQEPGSNEEIATFCKKNYGVSFPIMSKISVKGDDIHPLYKWLTTGELNNFGDNPIKWNFQKFLINENGEIDKVLSPKTKPDDTEIINWITSS